MNLKFITLAACAAMTMSLASCSDDDNNGPDVPDVVVPGTTTEEVFPEGVPSNVDGMEITTNDKGQVTSIKDGNETVSFKYGTFSRATNFDVLMEIRDAEYPNDDIDIYLQLNDKGFVKYALEVYTGGGYSDDEWWFEYNADGQLNYLKRTEGDNEESRITYVNGDATSVSVTSDDHKTPSVREISYTSDLVTTPIANKGGIMLFDSTLSVDMDEMEVAYFAGLLGKGTKNLPVKLLYLSDNGYRTFAWTLNTAGLPVKMVETEDYGSSTDYIFAW